MERETGGSIEVVHGSSGNRVGDGPALVSLPGSSATGISGSCGSGAGALPRRDRSLLRRVPHDPGGGGTPETGIGRWSDAEVAAAIRNGRRPDGSLIGPPMPVELYRGISDRDLGAMVAYLRTVPPVRHAVVERSTYADPLTPHGPPVTSVPDPAQDDPVARGAYLAGPVAHCMDCHTPPLPGEHRDWSRMGAGGVPFEGPWGVAVARNITPSEQHGIGSWTDEQIIAAVTKGISADGRRLVPPMGGRAPIWAKLTQGDLHDLVAYLRSLPARD